MGSGAGSLTETVNHETEEADIVKFLETLSPEEVDKVKGALDKNPVPKKSGCLGVIRLDYNYPPAPGDVDHPGSYEFDVHYRVVPGLTFEMCQNWQTQKTEAVEKEFVEAIEWLDKEKGVHGITGDCGFMMYMQTLARQHTKKPVFMSALTQLPAITCGYAADEQIAIFTANGKSLQPMRDLLRDECAVKDHAHKRYIFVGCENVPGFEAVAEGSRVPVAQVMPEMIKKGREVMETYPDIRCIVFECTELPPYSDAMRMACKVPVYDAITGINGFMSGMQDNPRFGLEGWQMKWDGKQDSYQFGQNLDGEDLRKLEHLEAVRAAAVTQKLGVSTQTVEYTKPSRAKEGTLGVVRLDYNYTPAPGDVDHPESYEYNVFYRAVPGLTFDVCQHWEEKKTPEIEKEFIEAIQYLDKQREVHAITGDCGFMMAMQKLARNHTKKPVIMSSIAQLPALLCALASHEKVAIFTANGENLKPMRELIKFECGIDTEEKRFIIVGCENVPGFEAVALGEKVNVAEVTPGIVAKAKEVINEHPDLRIILFECTELPPYSDAVRHATGLPVFDAITGINYFISGSQDNPLFGLQNWQNEWDGKQKQEYKFAMNLDSGDKQKMMTALSTSVLNAKTIENFGDA